MRIDRLLYIEDNTDQARNLMEMLAFHITNPISHYRTADDALIVLDTLVEKPVCLIVDLMLPGGMSGIDFIRRAHASYPAIPIIVVTAAPLREQIAMATGAGASGFVSKPFSEDQLVVALWRLNLRWTISPDD